MGILPFGPVYLLMAKNVQVKTQLISLNVEGFGSRFTEITCQYLSYAVVAVRMCFSMFIMKFVFMNSMQSYPANCKPV